MGKMVSVIVPAYNEARGIAQVVEHLLTMPLVEEVLVVDDGSTDGTGDIAQKAGACVLTLSHNGGKGQAMERGVMEAKNETLLFCDGDMYGFSGESVVQLIAPVLNDECDVAIGIRSVVATFGSVFPFLTQISGLRALTKKHWAEIPPAFIMGYQAELAMNFIARRNHWRVRYITIPGLKHTVKEKKYGLCIGMRARFLMITNILSLFLTLYVTRSDNGNKKRKQYE